MVFTQEDYIKIEQWLQRNSVKDTEFQEALPLKGEEIIAIVQDGHNKRVFIKDLVDQIFNLGVSDFLNVTDKYEASNISLEEAIKLIPAKARKAGQVITFLNAEGNWQIHQFKGVLNQWNHTDLWEDLFDWEKLVIDSILPDEEDLTKSSADENGNSYLSLKDREYNPEDFSGLGRVILRKNIIESEDPIYGKVKKNILYQDMINKSNTIYEIRYDFDLNGEEITIPEGCVLDFQGGRFSNGTIVLNDTKITQVNLHIFDLNLNISGKLKNRIYLEWFGYKSNPSNDAAPYFLKALKGNFDIQLLDNTYYINSQIILPTRWIHIYGLGNDSIINIQYNGFAFLYKPIEGYNNGVELFINKIQVQGNFPYVGASDQTETLTSFFKNEEGSYIYLAKVYDVTFFRLNEALHFEKGYWTRVNRSIFKYCKNAIHTNDANSSSFTDNQFRWIKKHSLWISNSNGYSPGTSGINISGNDFSSNSASVIFIDGTVSSMSFTGNYLEPAIEQYIPDSITYGIQVGVDNNNYQEEGALIPSLNSSLICGNTGWAESKNSKRIIKVYGNFSGNVVTMSADVSQAIICNYNIGNNEYDDEKVRQGYSFLNIYNNSYIKGKPVTNITTRTLQVDNVGLIANEDITVGTIPGRFLRINNFNTIGIWNTARLVICDSNDAELEVVPITEDSIKLDIKLPALGTFKFKIKNYGGSPIVADFLINYTISYYKKFM